MHLLDNKDRIGSLLLLVFSFTYLQYAFELPIDPTAGDESFNARTLPIGLAIAAIAFALIELFFSARRVDENRISEAVQGFSWIPTLSLVLLMVVYSLLFSKLGFVLSSYLFLHASFLILGERRIFLSGFIAASLVVFMWLMLTRVFGIFLDSGDLYRFLFVLVS
jgi:hypothetical protein